LVKDQSHELHQLATKASAFLNVLEDCRVKETLAPDTAPGLRDSRTQLRSFATADPPTPTVAPRSATSWMERWSGSLGVGSAKKS